MNKDYINILKNGGVGVLPTDTIYGLVGRVESKDAVRRIYDIKSRNEKKPLIILISSIKDLEIFGVELSEKAKIFLEKFWPSKVSVIFPFDSNKCKYLNETENTLAFRFPDKKNLIEIIKQTGPLVAPSANPEGLPPAININEAKKYFGDKVDFYIDEGDLISMPSTLVKINGDKIEVLRQGAVVIDFSSVLL